MRLVVISDSHSRKGNIFDIIEKHINDTDYFLCLGDCNSGNDFEDVKIFYENKLNIIFVCGNCDRCSREPLEREFTLAGKKIFMCHGHEYKVKITTALLEKEATKRKADIVLFGHTHLRNNDFKNNIHFFNPGTAQNGYYGIIDIIDNEVICTNEII